MNWKTQDGKMFSTTPDGRQLMLRHQRIGVNSAGRCIALCILGPAGWETLGVAWYNDDGYRTYEQGSLKLHSGPSRATTAMKKMAKALFPEPSADERKPLVWDQFDSATWIADTACGKTLMVSFHNGPKNRCSRTLSLLTDGGWATLRSDQRLNDQEGRKASKGIIECFANRLYQGT